MSPHRPAPRSRRWLLAGVVLGAAGLIVLLLAGCAVGFLSLAPTFLLGTILALGCYPAERLLHCRAPSRRRRGTRRIGRTWPGRMLLPRGGELLATGLAGRAPPPATAPA